MSRIERVLEGCYEVENVEFGRVYRWCPERVVVECSCGKKSTFTLSATTCECGVDHTTIVRRGSASCLPKKDETAHPWRYWRSSREAGIPF